MRKITVSTLLIVLLFGAGCGSKKKITNVSKGVDIEYTETKNDTKAEETKVTNTATGKVEDKAERVDIETVIEYVFNNEGRVVKATQRTHDRSVRTKATKTTGTAKDSATKRVDSVTGTVVKKEVRTEAKATDMQRTAKNPIWHWIGAGLLIVIVGFAFWKLVLKK